MMHGWGAERKFQEWCYYELPVDYFLECHFQICTVCILWIMFYVKLRSWFNIQGLYIYYIASHVSSEHWTIFLLFINNINCLSYLATLLSFCNDLICAFQSPKIHSSRATINCGNAYEVLLDSNYIRCCLTTLLSVLYQRMYIHCCRSLQRHLRQRIWNPLV
jgi:hypothetical protein